MSRLRNLFVALLALAFLVPSVQAQWGKCVSCTNYNPVVSEGGVGDLLLFPLFYAGNGVKTKIRVVNTSCTYGIVAKVVLRSSLCSEELRDFLIYLSPNDVWTAEVVNENGKIVVKSTDDSVIVPINHKVASESNPFVVSLRMPKNPQDVNNYGYIEVFAVAKVNWGWTDGSKTFVAIANENGFTNLHEFMYFLYYPASPAQYRGIAYCGGTTVNDLRGLIAPLAYNGNFDSDCDGTNDGSFLPVSPLYGTAEFMLPGAYAAYRATAVTGFVALGANVGCADYTTDYKIAAAIDTPLDLAGVVDCLDDALVKTQVYIPYYDPDDEDSCGSFAFLFSPTMQSKYGYYPPIDKYTCVTSAYTSSLWEAAWTSVLTGTIGIHVTSYDNSEHAVFCEFSPCLLRPYELYSIGPVEDIFDPFAFSEGWMRLVMPDNIVVTNADNTTTTVPGLPVIPLVGLYNADGITFVEPGYIE